MGSDLNVVHLSGEVRKPVDFATPQSYVELRVCHRDGGVMFLSLHVGTDRWLRLLEDLAPGDRIYAAGELAYARSDRLEGGGQHCLKVRELRRLTRNGRVVAAETGQGEDITPSYHTSSATGDRKRRRRGRRGAPQGRHP
jgi:hypothetical protein